MQSDNAEHKLAPIFKNRQKSVGTDNSEELYPEKIPTPKRKRTDDKDSGETYGPQRGRTPSGQVLTGKVHDLKGIFSEFTEANQRLGQMLMTTQEHDAHDQSSVNAKTNLISMSTNGANMFSPVDLASTSNDQLSQVLIDELRSREERMLANDARIKSPIYSKGAENVASKEDMMEERQVVDVRVVIEMFKELKISISKEIADIKLDVASIAATGQTSEEGKGKIRDMEKSIQLYDGENIRNKLRWKSHNMKEEVILGYIEQLNQRLLETQSKVEKLESHNAKRMMIITGFYGDQDKKVLKRQLIDFFTNHMQCDPYIEDLYTIGTVEPYNIVITLQSVADKQKIFANIHRVKRYVNKDGNKMFFRDFLTQEVNAIRKRKAEVKRHNNSKEEDLRKDLTYKKGILHVNTMPCPNPISPPDPIDAIKMTSKDLNEVMELPMNIGPKLVKKGNTFFAASIPANNFDDIQKAYMSLRLKHASARHIVAVWSIPTDKVYDGINFCEDDELGIGIPLLRLLLENDITNRAIFVVRKCGEKLFEENITSYTEAIKALIKQAPYNPILSCMQSIKEDTETKKQARGYWKNKNRGAKGGGRESDHTPPTVFHPISAPTKHKKPDDNQTRPSPTKYVGGSSPTFANVVSNQMDVN